jgi:vacuolar-type H+-ATPase subunit H
LSGIEAVKRIVETEAKARTIVEESRVRAQQILSQASQETENVRQHVLSSAKARREEILQTGREHAESEAGKSDAETTQQLEGYRKAFEGRKELAVKKAVELVLRG